VAGSTSTLTWNLVANSAGYVAGMNRAHTSTAKFKTELAKTERAQRSMTRYLVAGAAAAAVARFGVTSVKAYADAEKAQARLADAYRKFPKLADANISSLRALNGELQKKTRFDDDATAAAQANLAMYDLTGQQITTLTPLVQDLASAMGTDVTDAAGSLGKAFLGNARALKAVGIDFKATGDKAKDFDTIVAALRTKVGGFAESEGKTAAGQLAIMNNAVGELQESVGQALIPALTQMVNVITPAVQGFTELSPSTRTAAMAVAGVGTAAAIALPPLLRLNTALKESGGKSLLGVFGKGGPVVLAAAAIAAMGLAAKDAFDDLDAFDETLSKWGDRAPDVAALTDRIAEFQKIASDPGWTREVRDGWEKIFGGQGEIGRSREQLDQMIGKLSQLQAATSAVAWELKIPLADAQERVVESGISLAGTSAEVVARYRDYERTAAAVAGVTKEGADAWHDAEGNLKSFSQALDDLNGKARNLTSSKIALIEKTKDLAKGLREGSTGFTLSTKAGRENLSNLLEVTEGIEDMGAKMEANGKPREKVIAAMQREKDALVENLIAMGVGKARAKELADKFLKIPPAADAAATKVDELSTAVDNVPKTKTITFKVTAQMTAAGAKAMSIDKKDKSGPTGWDPLHPASGGLIRGPGTGTSDSIPAMVSNGEFVMRAAAVQRYGPQFFHALNFADGGMVDIGFGGGKSKKAKAKSRSRSRSTSKASGGRDWSIRDALRDGAALDFDFTAYGSAVERAAAATRDLADADRGVFEARRKINQAGSPADRAAAEQDLADALAAQAAAGKEVAAADKARAAAKPTGRNILGGFRAKAAKLDRFRRDLKTLKSWGLSGVILRQLIDSGIDDGGDMAAALVKDRSVIADLNKTQAAINKDAAAINGPGATGSTGGGGSTGSGGTTGSAGTVTIGFADASRPVVLQMDSEKVWKGLLQLKKAKGGASLNLD
jgi:hypothetical protein